MPIAKGHLVDSDVKYELSILRHVLTFFVQNNVQIITKFDFFLKLVRWAHIMLVKAYLLKQSNASTQLPNNFDCAGYILYTQSHPPTQLVYRDIQLLCFVQQCCQHIVPVKCVYVN